MVEGTASPLTPRVGSTLLRADQFKSSVRRASFLGKIPTSRRPQNLTFAGPDMKTLYVVGGGAVFKQLLLPLVELSG